MFMADKTQLYIEQLNELAINDSLTKAKNKTGYVKYINELTENASHEKPYAVVVLDINGLKLVNDKYGHEMGDKLIISSCERICKIFKNSEVFRIGGDEFVVILQDENFEKREKLIEIFNQQIISEKIIDVDVNVSIALGMSEFPKESNQYEQLFNLADERMYQNKIKMKKEINNI